MSVISVMTDITDLIGSQVKLKVAAVLRGILSNRPQDAEVWVDKLEMGPISTSSVVVPPAQNSGSNAIATASRKLNADAQQIAGQNAADSAAPLLDLSQSLVLAQAGANLISAENKMLGTLLDAFA
jgi:hypothetical protein